MRRTLEAAAAKLAGFVAQRDDLALVVRTAADGGAAVASLLEQLSEASADALFWTFTEPFTTAKEYAATVVESFAVRQEAVRLAMLAEDDPAPWPPLPPALRDDVPPAVKLRELMRFARSLLPDEKRHTLVWALLPGAISDPAGYAKLVGNVLKHDWPFPWCHHIRVIVRDEPGHPVLHAALAGRPRVQHYSPPFTHDAYEQGFEDAIGDRTLPLAERLTALLVSAAGDYSHRRYDLAIEKYRILVDYHAPRGDAVLSAISMNGLGEVYARTGNATAAGACFESAVRAVSTVNPLPIPVFLTVAMNLGALKAAAGQHADAASWLDLAQQCAGYLRAADVRLMLIAQLGQAQLAAGQIATAISTWTDGATAAAKLEMTQHSTALLTLLRGHYAATLNTTKLAEIDRQLSALPAVPVSVG